MSAPRMVSEREAVLRERKAFRAGCVAMHLQPIVPGGPEAGRQRSDAMKQAAERYPLPTVTRPRVVRDRWGVNWKIEDGVLLNSADGEWTSGLRTKDDCTLAPLLDRVKLWADLLANPTETVEDHGAVSDDVVSGRETV